RRTTKPSPVVQKRPISISTSVWMSCVLWMVERLIVSYSSAAIATSCPCSTTVQTMACVSRWRPSTNRCPLLYARVAIYSSTFPCLTRSGHKTTRNKATCDETTCGLVHFLVGHSLYLAGIDKWGGLTIRICTDVDIC